jgi:hypothetical protein
MTERREFLKGSLATIVSAGVAGVAAAKEEREAPSHEVERKAINVGNGEVTIWEVKPEKGPWRYEVSVKPYAEYLDKFSGPVLEELRKAMAQYIDKPVEMVRLLIEPPDDPPLGGRFWSPSE